MARIAAVYSDSLIVKKKKVVEGLHQFYIYTANLFGLNSFIVIALFPMDSKNKKSVQVPFWWKISNVKHLKDQFTSEVCVTLSHKIL